MGSAFQTKLRGREVLTIEGGGNTSPRQFVTQAVRYALDKLGAGVSTAVTLRVRETQPSRKMTIQV